MAEHEGVWEEREPPEKRPAHDEEARDQAAEADDTLAPGSMPGGPEYPEDASEGAEGGGAPAH